MNEHARISAARTVTSKGQTTIPKEVRDALGIKEGTPLDWTLENGELRQCEPRPSGWWILPAAWSAAQRPACDGRGDERGDRRGRRRDACGARQTDDRRRHQRTRPAVRRRRSEADASGASASLQQRSPDDPAFVSARRRGRTGLGARRATAIQRVDIARGVRMAARESQHCRRAAANWSSEARQSMRARHEGRHRRLHHCRDRDAMPGLPQTVTFDQPAAKRVPGMELLK